MKTGCPEKRASLRRIYIVGFHSQEVPKGVKCVGTGSRRVVTKGWGRGDSEFVFNGTDFQFGTMRKFWRRMVGWLHNNENVLNAFELFT